jgi:hypothetical protein
MGGAPAVTANIVSLCQAVSSALNEAPAGTFSEAFTAAYEYAPNYSVIDAKTLRVVVTDAGGQVELVARGRLGYTDSVRVVVLWRVDAGGTGLDTSKIGRALTLVEEIVLYLLGKNMAGYVQTGVVRRGDGEKEKQHYMPGNLEERVFASVLVLEYQTTESTRAGIGS